MKRPRTKGLIKVDLILKFMKDNKLSQIAFAKMCGLGISVLRYILSGKSHTCCTNLLRIAKAMNLKFQDLINH